MTFFEIATLEDWPTTLFMAIDSRGENKTPVMNSKVYIAPIFVVYIFITTFFIMNLFVSVIVDQFNEEIKRKQGSSDFTEE